MIFFNFPKQGKSGCLKFPSMLLETHDVLEVKKAPLFCVLNPSSRAKVQNLNPLMLYAVNLLALSYGACARNFRSTDIVSIVCGFML